MTEGVPPRRRANDRSPIEKALRYIGSQRSGSLVELLQNAIEWPTGEVGVALEPLIRPAPTPRDWSSAQRAAAFEQLIRDGVRHPAVGPIDHSRERLVLRAAFRLPDPDIRTPWAGTLAERWEQLRVVTSLFPHASTTQPMEAAWTRAVRQLALHLGQRIAELDTPSAWAAYRSGSQADVAQVRGAADSEFRPASEGAQPFIVDRLVVTVFMQGRTTARRITERVVRAQADDVEFYTSVTFYGLDASRREYVPVRPLWGCQADDVPGEPLVTRLRFPRPLQKGERAYFAAEAVLTSEPDEAGVSAWVDVNIDHHGIVRGVLDHGGTFPVSGLTIRVRFDPKFLPSSAWWYAETTEPERTIAPKPGDSRLIAIRSGEVTYTFTGTVCQPRETYGIGWQWS